MFAINELTAFFGWCTLINLALYLLSVLFVTVFKDFTQTLHSKVINIEPSELPKMYFNFLGNYKIAILVFNLTPYLALRVMS